MHVLPHRFVRIRHYGILSSSWKCGKLQALQTALQVIGKDLPVNTLLRKCPLLQNRHTRHHRSVRPAQATTAIFIAKRPVPVS